jgi:hypothetical protein
LPNSEKTTEHSLSQGTDPSEAVEIHVSETIPELQVIEPRELHVGESPVQYQEAPGYAWDSRYEVPDRYESTRIVLMVRDPFWMHAYWEIAEDISDIVTTALGPEGWLASRKTLRVHDVTDIKFDGSNAHRSVDIDIHEHATNWYINVDRPNRSYCAELGLIGSDGRFLCLSRSNTVRTPRAGASEVIDEEWMTISAIEKYYSAPTALPASPEMISAISERMHLEMGSEFVGEISSPHMAQRAKPRQFWLNAFVEVIVHGATEPDASLIIQGRPVRLRPDGTFQVRYALPDGEQIVDIEAMSKDGAMRRSITTRLTRNTW